MYTSYIIRTFFLWKTLIIRFFFFLLISCKNDSKISTKNKYTQPNNTNGTIRTTVLLLNCNYTKSAAAANVITEFSVIDPLRSNMTKYHKFCTIFVSFYFFLLFNDAPLHICVILDRDIYPTLVYVFMHFSMCWNTMCFPIINLNSISEALIITIVKSFSDSLCLPW